MQILKRSFTGTKSNEVTQRELENRKLARRAASEGFVLLKNEDSILPLKKGSKIGLYGAGGVKTIKGGTGSGDVNERDCVTISQGLALTGFEVTSKEWLESYVEVYDQARLDWRDRILEKAEVSRNFFVAYSSEAFQLPCGDPLNEAKAKADGAQTGIFVLSRIAGEAADRKDTEGDYYISADEKALLAQVCASYEQVVLVINTGGLVDLGFTDEFANIKAIIQFMQAGQEGGTALGDILSGDVTPSGKLTDSWAFRYEDYPNAETFSYKNGDVNTEKYEDGIYVGYRYFDTFDIPVRYSFGYGLSYTRFAMETKDLSLINAGTEDAGIQITVKVKNTGTVYAGKEVVQIYASCPQGKLPKEYRRLAGFAKTKLLAPGEAQEIRISFPLYQLASYRESSSSWTLEAGKYGIWVGNSLNSSELAGTADLDTDAVFVKGEEICPLLEELTELQADKAMLSEKERAWQEKASSANLPAIEICAAEIPCREHIYTEITDELSGKAGEIVNALSEEQLVQLAAGDPGKGQGSEALGSAGLTVPGAAAETSSAAASEPWNVASMVLADGPAGLRLNRNYQVVDGLIKKEDFLKSIEGGFFAPEQETVGEVYYQYCTAIPVGTLLAQSWDTELLKEVGEMIGHEMELFKVTLWLAPGMNIHRNPLCGRNFEYYSEDPLLAGIMASAMTLGVQRVPGCGTTIKHYACNNQEDNRMGSDSVISERALREIYLKGFEIAIKNAQPMSMMTSYNMVNGVHAANSYDLCTKAARDEWGFAGAIMTDWTTTNNSPRGICTAAGCMRAGNDMVMPGTPEDHENIREELRTGSLELKYLKRCICNTVNLALQSNQYEEAVSYLEQFENLDSYLKVD